jgi:hypothetical protein
VNLKLNEIIIKCECCGHLLSIYKDDDDGCFYLSMYTYGGPTTIGIWQRIKNAIRLIKTGKMFSDQIILSQDEAIRVRKFILMNQNTKQ